MSVNRKLKSTALIFSLLMLVTGLISSSCFGSNVSGTLEGTVSIGPIWPVERPGENPPVPTQVFSARKIVVYDESGQKIIEKVDITQINQSAKGSYKVQLRPGTYIVDILKSGIDRSGTLPAKVQIRSDEIMILNIDIDTGIR